MATGIAAKRFESARAGSAPWLAEHPGKRAAERFFLLYTPVWGAVSGYVMLTGVAESWGDVACMIYGVLIALPCFLGPPLLRAPAERDLPFWEVTGFKIAVWLTIFSFLLNYFGTHYFYQILHAHYGFQTEWNVNDVPFFLYLVTIAYFSTYFALINMGWRWARERIRPRSRAGFWAAGAALPFVVAGLESLFNANPFMTGLYCFDDVPFALSFGTVVYGTWFVVVMPFWLTLNERAGDRTSMRWVVTGALAGSMLAIASGELFLHVVAPQVTEVAWGHVGLRDYGESCLTPPRI